MPFDVWSWIVIPALIFCARLVDVSLSTVRHILVFRGQRRIVPFLAFFEVLVWLIAITQVMANLSNVASYLGWAGGFSAGTLLGMAIEERIALGNLIVRIIIDHPPAKLYEELVENGFAWTRLDAHGRKGPVTVLFVVVARKELKHLLKLIDTQIPGCF